MAKNTAPFSIEVKLDLGTFKAQAVDLKTVVDELTKAVKPLGEAMDKAFGSKKLKAFSGDVSSLATAFPKAVDGIKNFNTELFHTNAALTGVNAVAGSLKSSISGLDLNGKLKIEATTVSTLKSVDKIFGDHVAKMTELKGLAADVAKTMSGIPGPAGGGPGGLGGNSGPGVNTQNTLSKLEAMKGVATGALAALGPIINNPILAKYMNETATMQSMSGAMDLAKVGYQPTMMGLNELQKSTGLTFHELGSARAMYEQLGQNMGRGERGSSFDSNYQGFKDFSETSRGLSKQLGVDFDETTETLSTMSRFLKLNNNDLKDFSKNLTFVSRNTNLSREELLAFQETVKSLGATYTMTGQSAVRFASDMNLSAGYAKTLGINPQAMMGKAFGGISGNQEDMVGSLYMGTYGMEGPEAASRRTKQILSKSLEFLNAAKERGGTLEEQAFRYKAIAGPGAGQALSFTQAQTYAQQLGQGKSLDQLVKDYKEQQGAEPQSFESLGNQLSAIMNSLAAQVRTSELATGYLSMIQAAVNNIEGFVLAKEGKATTELVGEAAASVGKNILLNGMNPIGVSPFLSFQMNRAASSVLARPGSGTSLDTGPSDFPSDWMANILDPKRLAISSTVSTSTNAGSRGSSSPHRPENGGRAFDSRIDLLTKQKFNTLLASTPDDKKQALIDEWKNKILSSDRGQALQAIESRLDAAGKAFGYDNIFDSELELTKYKNDKFVKNATLKDITQGFSDPHFHNQFAKGIPKEVIKRILTEDPVLAKEIQEIFRKSHNIPLAPGASLNNQATKDTQTLPVSGLPIVEAMAPAYTTAEQGSKLAKEMGHTINSLTSASLFLAAMGY